MTTDITELAQRMSIERIKQIALGGTPTMGERESLAITALHFAEELKIATDAFQAAGLAQLAAEEALEKAQQRNAELESQNEYIRKRYQQLDLLIGKNILVMQAAIIEWQATGDAKNGLAWIYNTLFGPGELPDEAEKDAQAYFDRKYAPLDEELMALHKWFWEQSEAERAAAGIKVEAE
ncbi:TPA: ead/Ea22-like family protein [Escherichia coli]|nr:ead/Ea22-like family protein [Escherichia coli]